MCGRPRFCGSSLWGRLYVGVVERLPNQGIARFRCFDWRRRNTTKNDASILNRNDPVATAPVSDFVFGLNPGGNTKHGKIKGAAASQFLIRSAPAIERRQLNINQQLIGTFFQIVDAIVVVETPG